MKAYRGKDNKLRLFRPHLNCERLRKSALRAGLPDLNSTELAKLIDKLLEVDGRRWLPDAGTFLYIRPTVVGTQAALGVGKPSKAMLFVIAVLFPQFGQLGPGLKLLCSEGQVRAWPGGFGNAKVRELAIISIPRNSENGLAANLAELLTGDSSVRTMPPRSCLKKKPTKRVSSRFYGCLVRRIQSLRLEQATFSL